MTAHIPEAVAVDTWDGYTFARDSAGQPFTVGTATAFAALRNAGASPGGETYRVFRLVPAEDAGGQP